MVLKMYNDMNSTRNRNFSFRSLSLVTYLRIQF